MSRFLRAGGRGGLLLLLLSFGSVQAASDRATPSNLKSLEDDVTELSTSIDTIRQNFSQRSGMIGIEEAKKRYEEAVYKYLIGDFEAASTEFFILVRSKALANQSLAHDAEWYLGECLFEMGNYRTATEAYRSILDTGPTHPFFSDGVRRSLESFAILGDDALFDSYYNTYIATGKVKTTELINYTLAHSFRLRSQADRDKAGDPQKTEAQKTVLLANAAREIERSKAMIETLPATSEYYSRGRYMMGVYAIDAAQSASAEAERTAQLNVAIQEFQKTASVMVNNDEQKQVQELAILAIGSIYYELGQYGSAMEYYGKIDAQSSLYADRVYQSIWASIKQDDLPGALQQIDIFLLNYPNHRYTPSLRLLQGRLLMKQAEYDSAQVAFENVVSLYNPVVDRLKKLADGSLELRPYLNRVLDETAPDPGGMPPSALEIIYSEDAVRRAVAAWQGIQSERTELEEAERSLREIDLALSASGNTLGSYVAARNQINGARAALLIQRTTLIEVEASWIRSRVPSSLRPEIGALQAQRQALVERMAVATGVATEASDKVQIYTDQIQEVQQRAYQVMTVVEAAQAQAATTLEYLDSGSSQLSAAEAKAKRAELVAQQAELAELKIKLEDLQSQAIKRKILRTVDGIQEGEDPAVRVQVLSDINALRQKVSVYRKNVTDNDSATFFASVDLLWSQLDQMERNADAAASTLQSTEAREMQLVLRELEDQRRQVASLRTDLGTRGARTEELAMRILQQGMADARDAFREDVVTADKGVVDVYWVRNTQMDDDIEALLDQRSKLLAELDNQYRIIQETLER